MATVLDLRAQTYPVEERECLGIVRLLEALETLNPTAQFTTLGGNNILVVGINNWEVKCPNGYYLTEKDEITNYSPKARMSDTFQLV